MEDGNRRRAREQISTDRETKRFRPPTDDANSENDPHRSPDVPTINQTGNKANDSALLSASDGDDTSERGEADEKVMTDLLRKHKKEEKKEKKHARSRLREAQRIQSTQYYNKLISDLGTSKIFGYALQA